jgi:hypothetical protein
VAGHPFASVPRPKQSEVIICGITGDDRQATLTIPDRSSTWCVVSIPVSFVLRTTKPSLDRSTVQGATECPIIISCSQFKYSNILGYNAVYTGKYWRFGKAWCLNSYVLNDLLQLPTYWLWRYISLPQRCCLYAKLHDVTSRKTCFYIHPTVKASVPIQYLLFRGVNISVRNSTLVADMYNTDVSCSLIMYKIRSVPSLGTVQAEDEGAAILRNVAIYQSTRCNMQEHLIFIMYQVRI